MLSIQVTKGTLKSIEKAELAEKLFLDGKFVKCTRKENCEGCDYCETEENYDFIMKNQLALVFSFGPAETGKKVERLTLTGDGKEASQSSSKLTVIFNNGPDYLKGLWKRKFDKFDEIMKILNDIISFSWLPHNFIDPNSGTGPFRRNQLLESYLDKPLFPEFSDIFRKELGWSKIENPNGNVKKLNELIEKMTIKQRDFKK